MSDTTTTTTTTEEEPQALPGDGLREGIVDDLRRQLGDALIDVELRPQDDLWVRIATDSWKAAGEALYQHGFEYFCFLSAIDWMPSPYGRGEDDPTEPPPQRSTEIRPGVTGGDTRFQVFARLIDIRRHVGITLKADVPDDTLTIESWYTVFAGANWHERETHEMFGIDFAGHPDLRNMYLPTEFEGFPLRKDFPLLARMVKPWPGIVDVEPMPAEEQPPEDAVTGEVAPESPTPEQTDAGLGEPPAEDAADEAAAATSTEEAPDLQRPAEPDEAADEPAAGTAPAEEADPDTTAAPPDAEDPTGTVERGTLDDPERDSLSEPEPAEDTTTDEGDAAAAGDAAGEAEAREDGP